MSDPSMRDRFYRHRRRAARRGPASPRWCSPRSARLPRPARRRAGTPDRVINVGIREQLLVSVGGGLALAGMRPIVHTFAPFLVERAFEQVKLDLGHQGVGARAGRRPAAPTTGPSGGRTHQAPGDVALLDTLDGWTVHVPGHPTRSEAVLRAGGRRRRTRIYVRLVEHAATAAPSP